MSLLFLGRDLLLLLLLEVLSENLLMQLVEGQVSELLIILIGMIRLLLIGISADRLAVGESSGGHIVGYDRGSFFFFSRVFRASLVKWRNWLNGGIMCNGKRKETMGQALFLFVRGHTLRALKICVRGGSKKFMIIPSTLFSSTTISMHTFTVVWG